ncbi:MAG: molybdopterin cofactor-binding domain-containing protein [Sulfitobacter sp.]
MGRMKTIARRSFLIGSAAIVGGVAFGAYALRKPHDNPLQQDLAEGEATFNPWIKISAQGITLITPHPDIGQGAQMMQAMLMAEEMDLELDHFETSFGVPSAAYYNRALAGESVPFMSTDTSMAASAMRGVMGGMFKLIGAQLTGGSSSVPDSFDKLREAGAVARETLKAAAAQQSGIDVAQLRSESGAVVLPDGTRLAYMDLAALAAELPIAKAPALRDPSQWRLIGKPLQRLDIVAKSTGTLDYGIDLQMEGMLHATLRCNPYKLGELRGFDAAEALSLRGVRHVLEVSGGICVVADNTWRAFQGAQAVSCDWGEGPYPPEQADHWAAIEASFTKAHLDKAWRRDGNAETALAQAEAVVAQYRAPYAAHQPLEPLSVVMLVTQEAAHVWTSHQVPRFAQDRVAEITGLPVENVHLHNQFAGGSFGHRLEFDYIDRTAQAAMQIKGTPIKMTLRREEDFIQDYTRQIGMARGRGAVSNGQVEAMVLDIATPSVSRSQAGRLGMPLPGPDTQIAAGAWNMPYDLPHLSISAYAVPELAPISSWRSVGAVTAGFFGESFLDELIHAAGADPMEERLRLCNDPVARKVLEAAAEMSNWGSALPAGAGRGVALVNSFGVPVAEVVELRQTPAGIKIDKVWTALDVGRVVDPVNFENNVQGGVIWGLGHAINAEITYTDGIADQDNFYTHAGLRLYQTPEIFVKALENSSQIRGVGEPPVPPAAPALANAIFAATGTRLREMPFANHMDFV